MQVPCVGGFQMSDLQKFEILREYETIILRNDLRIYESILCQVAEFLEEQSNQLLAK